MIENNIVQGGGNNDSKKIYSREVAIMIGKKIVQGGGNNDRKKI
jgi:hypothetical protein